MNSPAGQKRVSKTPVQSTLNIMPVLADAEGIGAVILAVITVIGWIASLVSNKNQKGPPVANRPRPPVRPRDDRLQQEINIFLEETGVKLSLIHI